MKVKKMKEEGEKEENNRKQGMEGSYDMSQSLIAFWGLLWIVMETETYGLICFTIHKWLKQ